MGPANIEVEELESKSVIKQTSAVSHGITM